MTPSPSPAPLNAAAVLRRFGLRPDKKLGQNFLQDDGALKKIIAAAEIGPGESVLEIGPGVGSLTRYLALAASRVTAVELDTRLLPALQSVVAPYENVTVIQGDILKFPPAELKLGEDYLVVANIPYNITSAILRHLLENEARPRRVILTIQREVAERVCAGPGEMSLLALSVQVYGQPSIAAHIPAGAFFPAPNVDSAVLKIEILPEPRLPFDRLETFFKLTRAGFSQKRKTLRNSLSAGLGIKPSEAESMLARAGIDPQRRAETLSIDEWGELVKETALQD
ncbi:MAG: 16S rRNA (adenine(1518)-N(6)/adenine(1519)-N(6))-dimethyltransferase RsmA [Chloroflexota bacterium]